MKISIQAIIFAGGKGKRLLPLTNLIPKPLLKYNNKFLIEYSLETLIYSDISNIGIVTKEEELFKKCLNYDLYFISTEGNENIFYVLLQSINYLHSEYVIYLDGDSVLDKSIINTIIKSNLYEEFDLFVALSSNSSSTSQWNIILNADKVIDIKRKGESIPHFAIICKTEALIKFKMILEKSYCLEHHKYENDYLPNLEEFYLGWGLIIKLFLTYGFNVICHTYDAHFKNINSPSDFENLT